MDKPAMCRICLVQNVRMHVVLDNSLQELYETLTDVPFVTEDCRPMLACFFCCAQMKQCEEFQRKCLEAEELFSKMLNEDCESISSVNRGNSGFYGGFVKTTTELISIDDTCQTENNDIKEELPDFDDVQGYIIGPGKETTDDTRQTENNVIQENLPDFDDIQTFIIGPGTETIVIPDLQTHESLNSAPHHSQANPQVYVPFIKYTTVVEQTQPRGDIVVVAKFQGDLTTDKQKNEASHSKMTRNTDSSSSKSVTESKKTSKGDQRSLNRGKKLKQRNNTQVKDKPYKCNICQYSCVSSYRLNIHSRRHTGERPYECHICHKLFTSNRNLKVHILIHAAEKPYKCDICPFAFISSYRLKIHRRNHTGEKPYECDVCHKFFKSKSILRNHIGGTHEGTQTGEKPHRRDIGGSYFKWKHFVTSDKRTQTSEVRHKCDICHQSFSTPDLLTNHSRIHHIRDKPKYVRIAPRPPNDAQKLAQTREINVSDSGLVRN